MRQRLADGLAAHGALRGAGFRVGVQALHHLQGKGPQHAARAQLREQVFGRRGGFGGGRAVQPIAQGMGGFARRLFGGHALGQAAQVFNQHHAQGGGQRPQLALGELVLELVGAQEVDEQGGREGAVGMRHVSPGDGVDPWQPHQRAAGQHRQAAEIAPRQAVVHLARLRDHEVDVVQQPFTRRADVAPALLLLRDEAVGLVQHHDVLAQPRKERRRTHRPLRPAVLLGQAVAELRKARGPQQFTADGRRQPAARCGQQRRI